MIMLSTAVLFGACFTITNAFSPVGSFSALSKLRNHAHAPTKKSDSGPVFCSWLQATRKDFTSLDEDELEKLARAFNTVYEDEHAIEEFAQLHQQYFPNGIHWGPVFFPWHRDFLRKMELKLQSVEPSVTLPYWNWTNENSRNLNVDKWQSFFGGRSNTGGKFDNWDYTRSLTPNESSPLPSKDDVCAELEKDSFLGFRGCEGTIHVPGHVWTGGSMASAVSPRDPLFYLHHCELDRIWSIWQLNHASEVQYTNEGIAPSDRPGALDSRPSIDELMVSFDSSTTDRLGTTPPTTPGAVLDHTSLGYDYEQDEALEIFWANRNPGNAPLITKKTPLVRKVNLRSVSSGNFLDGRNPEHTGPQVYLTNRNPVGDKYLQWELIPFGETYAIRSVSSGNYLDGRNPEHTGPQLYLTNRNPEGDKYLQWELIPFGETHAIRSVSSGNYLDGRAPQHTGPQVYLTNRSPAGDNYLQWKVMDVE